MNSLQIKLLGLLAICVIFLTSCVSGLDPIASSTKDLTMSWSLPIGNCDFEIDNAYYTGAPNINLGLNVPNWARHSTVYFTDTIPADLSRIYEKSTSISYLAFKINIWNDYTSPGSTKIYFVDESYSKLDSINLDFIKGHYVRNNLMYSGYSHDTKVFEPPSKLQTVKYLIFQIKVNIDQANSTNDLQYYNQYKLTCHIGARVDFILTEL